MKKTERYWYFTGDNIAETVYAQTILESYGIIYATNEVYNYEPGFKAKMTLGLGNLGLFERLKIRFIFWWLSVEGRIWYAE